MSLFLVLEARIHQLQSSDFLLGIQRAKVQFIKAPSLGKGTSSVKGSKSIPQEINAIPKSRQMVTKGNQPSRWMKKLTEEKKNKLKIEQHLQQKIRNIQEKPSAPSKSKSVKSSLMHPGTTHKTITSTGKKKTSLKKKSKGQLSLADEIHAAVPSTHASTLTASAAPGTAAQPNKASKGKHKHSKKHVSTGEDVSDVEGSTKELLEAEELERRLSQQVQQWKSSSKSQQLQEDSEGNGHGDIHLSIRSYLEACVFARETERAHHFLLSQHRVRSRRKHLNTDVYNIMMRVWAKKVSLPWDICLFRDTVLIQVLLYEICHYRWVNLGYFKVCKIIELLVIYFSPVIIIN